jgi:hypothetical protein
MTFGSSISPPSTGHGWEAQALRQKAMEYMDRSESSVFTVILQADMVHRIGMMRISC